MAAMDAVPTSLFELASPGPLRDRLVAAVLTGAKTSTSSLLEQYDGEDDPIRSVGQLSTLVDSGGHSVAVLETTEVRLVPLSEVDLDFAVAEGEGYESVEAWRAEHEEFWRRTCPEITVSGSTLVVAERFRLVHLVTGA